MSLIDFFTKKKPPKDDFKITLVGESKEGKEKNKLDAETEALLERWDKLEKEIIGDDAILEATTRAFKLLEKIFDYGCGDKGIVKLEQESKKRIHGEKDWLKKLLYLKGKKEERGYYRFKNIFGLHAANMTGESKIALWRSSILHRFLEKTQSGKDIDRLKKLVQILDKQATGVMSIGITNLNYFERSAGERNIIKTAIDTFLSILERNIKHLKENKQKIIKDEDYIYSLTNLIKHEIIHILWHGKDIEEGAYKAGINESWAHDFQILSHLYEKDSFIHPELLNKEIDKIFEVIEDKSKLTKYSAEHPFMSAFMVLFAALILTDVSLRQEGKTTKQLNKAFKSGNVHEIYLVTMNCMEKLKNKKLKKIIQQKLIKHFLKVNKEIKIKTIERAESCFESLHKLESMKGIKSVIERFLEKLNVLLLIDPSNKKEVDKLKNKMEKELEKIIRNYFSKAKDEVKGMVETEEDSIDKLEKLFTDESKQMQFFKSKVA